MPRKPPSKANPPHRRTPPPFRKKMNSLMLLLTGKQNYSSDPPGKKIRIFLYNCICLKDSLALGAFDKNARKILRV